MLHTLKILSIHTAFVAFSLATFIGLATSHAQESEQLKQALMLKKHAAVFEKYCYDCHDSSTQEGSVDLEAIPFEIGKDIETAEKWAKVLNAINSGEMPPEDSEQIADDEKLEFLDALSTQMVMARKILGDSGGVITMRRLNRREYQNTIESLIGVQPDVSTLPDDQATAGFDTAGASLFFSSDQLEQYLAVARKSLELALNPPRSRKSKTVRIEPEERYTPHYTDVAKELRRRLKNAKDYAAQSERPPSDFDMLDKMQARKQLANSQKWLPQIEEYLKRPENKTGASLILTIKFGGPTKIKLPTIGPTQYGKYKIRLRAAAYKDAPERFQYVEFTSGLSRERNHLGWRKVNGTLDEPEIIEFPIVHRPGDKLNYMIHQRTHQDRGDKNLWQAANEKNGIGIPPGVWVDWAELIGPEPEENDTFVKQILPDRPKGWSDRKFATEAIKWFAKKAFRGKEPKAEYLDRLVKLYLAKREQKLSVKDSLIDPLSVILASPSFLYMTEPSESEKQPLTDKELAVRLSYFLWSTTPDKELMSLARSGKLSNPKVLREQTNRLLADEQADRFVRGFTHQWLEMERIDMFQFHGGDFPTFDNAVRANARDEIFSMVRFLMKDRMPLKDLLHADYVVVNDLLAGYYGIDNVEGHEFRKVSVGEDSIRGGLLGTAAIHCMGSDGIRSSPVERGAWVLRHLVNNPPPPAPPNVPQLSRLDGEVLPVRKLQRAHQEQPQCAQCHQKIDPIGYGLENFDASGSWREVETIRIGKRRKKKTREFPIDASGVFPGGEKFNDFFELRSSIASHEDDFARGFAEALIAYGLGRPFGFTDQGLADDLVEAAKKNDYEINLFIHALIQSKAFKTK